MPVATRAGWFIQMNVNSYSDAGWALPTKRKALSWTMPTLQKISKLVSGKTQGPWPHGQRLTRVLADPINQFFLATCDADQSASR